MTRRRFPPVIAFFGPDGSGKSTQARLLLKHLRLHGYRARYAWIRGRHSFAFALAFLLTKLGYHRNIGYPSGTVKKVFDPQRLPGIRRLWAFIELVSVLPWILLRVQLPIMLGYTIVADHYVVDTVVYLAYWLGEAVFQSFSAKVLLSLIPRGSRLLFLNADTNTLSERITNDMESKDYLKFQQRFCLKLAKTLHASNIDTSELTIEEAFKVTLKVLDDPRSRASR